MYRSNYESWHLEKNPEFPMDANTQNIYNTVQKMIEYGETEYGVNFPVFQIVERSVEDKGGAQTVFGGWNRSDRIFIPSNFKERDISPALRDLGFKGDTGYIGGVLQEYIHSVKGNQFTLPGATLGSYAQIAKDMITIGGEEYSITPWSRQGASPRIYYINSALSNDLKQSLGSEGIGFIDTGSNEVSFSVKTKLTRPDNAYITPRVQGLAFNYGTSLNGGING